jgi:ATP-binding cassette subfamily B protein
VRFELSAGVIVSFYLFLNYFFEPVQSLADALNHVTRAISSIERLYNLFDIKSEVVDKEGSIDVFEFKGKIEFKHVYFSYEPDVWILKDVSFVINPKETVAFVGATGAGKTTILNLIVRNYEIQSGEILLDDININDISLSSLRRGVGQMLQDVFLFTGSIKDNITLFDDSYTDDEINAAIKYVNADTFIDKLDHGLNEQIVERGENFSTGQRQLLSFARTIIHKPQIMILDEATANIDTETELVIQESLNNIKNIGTMLIVAHRLSTIQNADKIIVLSHGEIIESGNHEELVAKEGYYFNLYKLQFEND